MLPTTAGSPRSARATRARATSSAKRAGAKRGGGGGSLSRTRASAPRARREDRATRNARGPRASGALSLSRARGRGRARAGESATRARRRRRAHVVPVVDLRAGRDQQLRDRDVAVVCCHAQRVLVVLRARGRQDRGSRGRCYLWTVFSRSRSPPARAARGLVCVRGGVGSNGSAAPARPRGRRTFRGKRAAASDARRRPKPLLGETGLVVTGSLPRSQRRPNGRANRRTRHFSADRARRGQWHGVGAAASVGGVE